MQALTSRLACVLVLLVLHILAAPAYLLCRLGIRPQVEKWLKGKMRGAKLRECC